MRKLFVLLKRCVRNQVCVVGISGILILFFGLIMAFYGFPKIIGFEIHKRIILKEDTENFAMWRNPPFPLTFKVYLFNITNPEEISNGSKPRLQEIGPYVYDQYRSKHHVRFDGHEKIVYDLKKEFHFNQDLSKNYSENDEIIMLNVALLGLVLTAHSMVPSMMAQVDLVLPHLFNFPSNVFMKTTVRDVLFDGVLVNCSTTETMVGLVCEAIKNNLPPSMRPTSTPSEGFLFSMFYQMNGTLEGPYSISTGLGPGGIANLGNIISFRNSSVLDAWDGDCSQLNGTDSTIFPPIDEANIPKTIHIFQPDLCRSMYAEFKRRGQALGLPALRYEAGRSLLESKETNPDNACYCDNDWSISGVGCEMDGVMGLEDCQGVPVVISYPHFYLASPVLLNYIEDGLYPNKNKHQTFIDIEPKTGAAIRGAKRLQFNMELSPIPHITVLTGVPQGLFPILWVEEGAEIDADAKALLDSVYSTVKIVKVVQWMIVGVGGVMLLAACRLGARGSGGGTASWGLPPDPRPKAALRDHRNEVFSNRVFSVDDSIPHK